MSNINTGGPAFPGVDEAGDPYTGMTLRDYFAAKAMQAVLAHPDSDANVSPVVFAKAAYEMANAMLKAREA